MASSNDDQQLIVVSNRLPFVFRQDAQGGWQMTPGSGGLITALLPVLKSRGGVWIGWPGAAVDAEALEQALPALGAEAGYQVKPVHLTENETQKFYLGFSNEIIWPLFHDLQSLCNFDGSYWEAYRSANVKYAKAIAETAQPGDLVWVHDYHLINVAREARARGVASRLAFFLHIPFPSPDIFLKLPWRFELLHALLEYDLVGFQTMGDRRNFIQCLRRLVPAVTVRDRGQVVTARYGARELRIGTFPISIDYGDFSRRAASPEVAEKVKALHAELPNRQLILGVDRLDYTKGIPHRLMAFRNALQRYPELTERVTLIEIVVPSREDIPQYHELRVEIERLVGEINGQFTRPGGWVPIHYVFRFLESADLLSYYRAAQIALLTPLKDGMNLVAKEYCACSIEEDCALILSEFAGAAAELQLGALLVNPYDVEGMADAIYQAFKMGTRERKQRMRRMRRQIQRHDIYAWVEEFLAAALQNAGHAVAAPLEYQPRPKASASPT